MSTLVLESPRTALSSNWIISKRDDLIWFIGSALVGYLALAAFSAGASLLTIYLLWSVLVDGPHLFATATRTYFDKTARQRLGFSVLAVVPFLLLLSGPIMYVAGFGFVYTLVFLAWAQYHIAKQHIGFVMLYKKKTGERNDFNLDRRFVLVTVLLPWAVFLYANTALPAPRQVQLFALFGYLVFVVFYVARQVRKVINREVVNTPKLLLLALVAPLHWLTFLYAAGRPERMLIAGIAVNIGHSIQYHRITWFHNRNRYGNQPRETTGLASIINSRAVFYFFVAVGMYGLLYALPSHFADGNLALLAVFSGFNMTHFYIDAKIWKVSSDKELAAALRL